VSPIEAVLIAVGLAVAGAGGFLIARRRHAGPPSTRVHQILLPFTGQAISRRALDAALRIAKAENATLMPAYLAIVPMHLPLDTPLPRVASKCMPLLETIEQRAAAQGVPVDARIEVGRSYRHALLRLLENETVDRVVVSATALPRAGFSADDLAWLLQEAPAEVLILRPALEDTRMISANNGSRPKGAPRNGATRPPGIRRQL
jgi:nucleotide-binding universal stress UspA family protein